MVGVVHVDKVSRYLDVDAAARLGVDDKCFQGFELALEVTTSQHCVLYRLHDSQLTVVR